MQILVRRLMFYSLVGAFLIYSWLIYTDGTEQDKGAQYLTEEARSGKLLFQEFNCISCHQLYGLGGYMGPDLTNVMSTKGKGKAYAEVFLRHGTVRMPNFRLSETQIRELVAFLEYVDKTGISPPVGATIESDGSITLPEHP